MKSVIVSVTVFSVTVFKQQSHLGLPAEGLVMMMITSEQPSLPRTAQPSWP